MIGHCQNGPARRAHLRHMQRGWPSRVFTAVVFALAIFGFLCAIVIGLLFALTDPIDPPAVKKPVIAPVVQPLRRTT